MICWTLHRRICFQYQPHLQLLILEKVASSRTTSVRESKILTMKKLPRASACLPNPHPENNKAKSKDFLEIRTRCELLTFQGIYVRTRRYRNLSRKQNERSLRQFSFSKEVVNSKSSSRYVLCYGLISHATGNFICESLKQMRFDAVARKSSPRSNSTNVWRMTKNYHLVRSNSLTYDFLPTLRYLLETKCV